MKLCLFADVDPSLNPYILIFKRSLERHGFSVDLEKRISLRWLFTDGRLFDCVHLHWIGSAYRPENLKFGTSRVKKTIQSCAPIKAFRSALRLAHFSLSLIFCRFLKKRIVYTLHNLPNRSEKHWYSQFLERVATRIVFTLADRVHVQSEYARRILKTEYNRTHGVIVVPHGNYNGYYKNNLSQTEARRLLQIPVEAFVFLFLGLLRPYKGIEDLIASFGQLIELNKQRATPIRLLVVGSSLADKRYENALQDRTKQIDQITFMPKFVGDEEIQIYMRACNACVLPYKNITTSGSAMLSLSFGRPLVAPAIAFFPELVNERVGVLYDPADPVGLTSALDQAARKEWLERTILNYAEEFDWRSLGNRLARLYQ